MTEAELARVKALETAVSELKTLINRDRFMSPRLDVDAWMAAKKAAPLTTSGDRNVYDRMREIGISQDNIVENIVPELRSKIAAIGGSGGGTVVQPVNPTPIPTPAPLPSNLGSGNIRALTQTEINTVVAAVDRGISNGAFPWTDTRDRIKSELNQGIYSYFETENSEYGFVQRIKALMFDARTSVADRMSVDIYRRVIDQRDPVTNLPLVKGDARVVFISGIMPEGATTTVQPVPVSEQTTTTPTTGAVSDDLPPAFQWPRAENGFNPPAGSGAPSGKPADNRVHRESWVCVSNVAPEGTTATSGPNGQTIGINGGSKGKIRVNYRGGAEGDGGMRDITNYINLAERPGVGTISRRGYDIFCSVPDAVSIQTALWTTNPDGKRDGGIFLLKRIDAGHFIGNWSDPALDYENRTFVISGGDQPDRDRFSTKSGADSNAGYGWRVDKPRNSANSHPTYSEGGYTDKGDFLLRLFHDNGQDDVGRYSRYKTFNEGRGVAFATSDGTYSSCKDVLVMQPGGGGQPGRVDIAIEGYGLRILETYDLPDGRKGLCFTPGRIPNIQE